MDRRSPRQHASGSEAWTLTNRIGEGNAPMGAIGTERREVEFEPLD